MGEDCLGGYFGRGSSRWLSMLCVILKAKAVHQSVKSFFFWFVFLPFIVTKWREHIKMAKQVSILDGKAV